MIAPLLHLQKGARSAVETVEQVPRGLVEIRANRLGKPP